MTRGIRDRHQRGDIVLGWLFRLVVFLGIFGFFAYEAGAVIVARVTIESIADDALSEAAVAYSSAHNYDDAAAAAREFAESKGASFVALGVSDAGKTLRVTVSKRAKTIVLHRLGPTKGWTLATATRERGVY